MTKLQVLLVDDDPEVRTALARDLRGEFEVVDCDGGVGARRVLAERGDFAAIVSDLNMETRTAGVELLEEVRRRFPGCGRVLVSGGLSPELAVTVRTTGAAHELVSKPWRAGELRAAVRRALAACAGATQPMSSGQP